MFNIIYLLFENPEGSWQNNLWFKGVFSVCCIFFSENILITQYSNKLEHLDFWIWKREMFILIPLALFSFPLYPFKRYQESGWCLQCTVRGDQSWKVRYNLIYARILCKDEHSQFKHYFENRWGIQIPNFYIWVR